jgi:cytoskeleton protein RodZ
MDDENNTQQHDLKSIGGILLLARTEMGLSQDDIAKKLYLSITYIALIENDEFDQLQQKAVFIRGYIRSYARLVNLPEDEIVSLLDRSGIKDKEKPRDESYRSTREQINARDKNMRIVTYSIVGLFLVLLFIWWHSRVSTPHTNKILAPQMSLSAPATAPVATTPNNVNANKTKSLKQQLTRDNG